MATITILSTIMGILGLIIREVGNSSRLAPDLAEKSKMADRVLNRFLTSLARQQVWRSVDTLGKAAAIFGAVCVGLQVLLSPQHPFLMTAAAYGLVAWVSLWWWSRAAWIQKGYWGAILPGVCLCILGGAAGLAVGDPGMIQMESQVRSAFARQGFMIPDLPGIVLIPLLASLPVVFWCVFCSLAVVIGLSVAVSIALVLGCSRLVCRFWPHSTLHGTGVIIALVGFSVSLAGMVVSSQGSQQATAPTTAMESEDRALRR